jgi:hypothetical protein
MAKMMMEPSRMKNAMTQMSIDMCSFFEKA